MRRCMSLEPKTLYGTLWWGLRIWPSSVAASSSDNEGSVVEEREHLLPEGIGATTGAAGLGVIHRHLLQRGRVSDDVHND